MEQNRTISVRAKTDMYVLPDYTTVNISLRELESDYQKAFAKLQDKADTVKKCAQICGICGDEVKSVNFYSEISKKWETDKKGNSKFVVEGYSCNQRMVIGFPTNGELLGKLLESISAEVDNPDVSISFSLKDRSKIDTEILEKLVAEAMKKAEIFCKSSNAKVGRLLSVNYNQGNLLNFSNSIMPVPFTPPRSGETAQLRASMAPPSFGMPSAVNTPVPTKNNMTSIAPMEKHVEEEAVFVWEIIDN